MFNNPRLINFIANMIMLLASVAIVLGAAYWFIHRPMFTITQLTMEPKEGNVLEHVSPASIQSTVAGKIKGNFFTIDLNELKRNIETAPWVRHVDISRVWPNGLLLRIEEHEAYAKWNDDELINTWAELFSANREELDNDINYPQYFGPEGSERLVVQRAGELATLLSPLNLQIKEVALSERYAWRVTLSNDVVLILGRDAGAELADPLGGQQGAVSFAATAQRFVQAWPVLLERSQGKKLTKVDLRYTKGFAVTYEPAVNSDSKEKK